MSETATAHQDLGAPRLPGKPTMLSHAAYITHDTEATAAFFTEVLGMELVNAVLDDAIPSTGEPVPYFHSFFKMKDGSTIAFFEAPELPPLEAPPHPAYNTFQHLALEVDTTEEVDAWAAWIRSKDVDVIGPVDHQIIYSIYFHDPSGLRLEITTPTQPVWNDNEAAAHASLKDWAELKAKAKAEGKELTEVVAAFCHERSHRRNKEQS